MNLKYVQIKYVSSLLLLLLILSCKKDNIASPESLITKYRWYPYKLIDTFFSENLDTVYRIQSFTTASCEQSAYYQFYSDGKVDRYFPCYTSPKMISGTWNLSSDTVLSVSIGFPSSVTVKLISIDKTELKVNTKWPYNIYSSSAPPEFGIRSSTTVFKHK